MLMKEPPPRPKRTSGSCFLHDAELWEKMAEYDEKANPRR
jgi:hypothetical protein